MTSRDRYLTKAYTESRDKALAAVAVAELMEEWEDERPEWVVALEEDAPFMRFEPAGAHSGKSWCDECAGRCRVC